MPERMTCVLNGVKKVKLRGFGGSSLKFLLEGGEVEEGKMEDAPETGVEKCRSSDNDILLTVFRILSSSMIKYFC